MGILKQYWISNRCEVTEVNDRTHTVFMKEQGFERDVDAYRAGWVAARFWDWGGPGGLEFQAAGSRDSVLKCWHVFGDLHLDTKFRPKKVLVEIVDGRRIPFFLNAEDIWDEPPRRLQLGFE